MDHPDPLGFNSIRPHLTKQVGDPIGWKDGKKPSAGPKHPASDRGDLF